MSSTPSRTQAAVRNPIAGDPEIAEIMKTLQGDHPEAAEALRHSLKRMGDLFRTKGAGMLKKRKYMNHGYWMVNAVYARHIALSIPRPTKKATP